MRSHTPVSVVGPSKALNDDGLSYLDGLSMPHLEDIYASPSAGIFTNSSYDDEGVVTDFNNLETTVNTRSKVHKNSEAHALWYLKRSLKHWKIKVGLMLCKRNCCSSKFRRNKKDERGVVVRNKVRLVAQRHRQEEGIDYDKVFALVARIEAIRIFLALSSYMGSIVYQIDVKSAFMYGTIDEEVYMTQPSGFVDLKFPNKVKQKEDGIFIIQGKYVTEILKKFNFLSVKTATTPIETQKPLVKDKEAADVDVHLYRSMIGSLMYLTAFRPDIMFAVCACSRFQVTPKTSHLQAVKRILMYLKGQPKLGLWYPKVSSFNLEAYSDSDYAATLFKGRLLEVTTAKHTLMLLSEQTTLGKDFSNPFIADNLPKIIWVHTLEQSKTAQDLVIKKLQKKVKRIERKIKARTPGMTLFNIGNFRKKSLDKENVSKQGRYLKKRPMFEESDFDNIDEWLMKTMIEPNEEDEVGS
uniref:Retrovirus-related Pol polyprotein from transposon TNT 1-94 n=1 Tax=Tanacetum cinerariifolium TaxID=118510 RepID=A0A699ID68_TANCI|nr:retrovirus-related Pol polyprotein from transposon TNT 1-94 [Tanacetum cinerariifolium]